MKRKNITPKKPKRRLSCGTLLLVAVCGVIYLAIPRTPRARVAVTPTNNQAAATNISDTSTSARPTRPRNITPNAVITNTPTDTPSQTWYVVGSANLRSCASTVCNRVASLSSGDEISVIGSERGATISGSDIWRIVDHDGERAYIHSSLTSENPVQPTAAPVQAGQPAVARPDNCSTAVAAGMSAQQAAQWSHLDRDGDGVACYGE